MSRSDPHAKIRLSDLTPIDARFSSITNLIFNSITLILFAALVYYHDGVGVFFKGKYGGAASTALLYYSWNSMLFLTAVHNLQFRKFLSAFSLFGIGQIFLLFVGGDRTIPLMYLAAAIYNYLRGATPLLMPRRARALIVLSPVILPLAIISKSLYTVLPRSGFSIKTAEAIRQNFVDWAVKDFEPAHTMLMFKSIASNGLPYGWSDLIRGLPAALPFSSYFNIDPHMFSEMVKARFFSSWGPSAGVGANFWAQGYVLLGLAGVMVFAALVLLSLRFFERAISRTSSSSGRTAFLVCGVIIAFYVHRNSLEQILAFLGRYATIAIIVGLIARIVCNSVATRDRRTRLDVASFQARQVRMATLERRQRNGAGQHG